jgi:hypothetical protein
LSTQTKPEFAVGKPRSIQRINRQVGEILKAHDPAPATCKVCMTPRPQHDHPRLGHRAFLG